MGWFVASKDHPKARVAVDAAWTAVPDYRKMALELAQLGAEAARRARVTGNGHYDRLAHTLTSRAGEILDDLERSGKA
jgi:hypothetical protein